MEQAANPSSQWKELKSETNDKRPYDTSVVKGFISLDHLILLTGSASVYTFHLKNLSWSSHYTGTLNLTPRSSLVRPGLIIDMNMPASSTLFRMLIFETDEEPKNFRQTNKEVQSFNLAQFSSQSFNADQTSIYLFGGKRKSYHRDPQTNGFQEKLSKSNALIQVDIDFLDVSELFTGEKKPCERTGHLTSLQNGQLYVFGGKDQNENPISDLWVLNLFQMRWNQLDFKGIIPVFKSPSWIVTHDQQILLFDEGHNSILNYSLNEKSWEIFRPGFPPNCSLTSEFLTSQGSSTIFFISQGRNHNSKKVFSALYSLQIKSKVDQPNGKQLESLMHQLCEEKTNADVIFNVENEEIPANKCILSLRSPHFKNAFSSNMMESHSLTIPIKDVKANVFKAMLRWIYFSDVGLNSEIAEDLFKLAHEYRLEELKNDCEKYLLKDISTENAIKYIHFAEKYEAPELRKACIAHIVKNIDKFFETQDIKELDNQTILEICKLKI